MTQEVIGINIAASGFQYVKRKIDGLHKTQTVEKVHNGNKSIFYIGSTLHITTLYEGCIRVNGLGNLTYEGEKKLCLVRETKGTKDMNKVRPDERDKIRCGVKHFEALGVDYDYAVSGDEV